MPSSALARRLIGVQPRMARQFQGRGWQRHSVSPLRPPIALLSPNSAGDHTFSVRLPRSLPSQVICVHRALTSLYSLTTSWWCFISIK